MKISEFCHLPDGEEATAGDQMMQTTTIGCDQNQMTLTSTPPREEATTAKTTGSLVQCAGERDVTVSGLRSTGA